MTAHMLRILKSELEKLAILAPCVAVLAAGAMLLCQYLLSNVLRATAQATSSEWVSMLVARYVDISALFSGGPPSVQTKHLLEESSQVGDIYRSRTWDTAGNPVFKSERMTSAGAPIAITGILLHFCLGEI
jgi:hypothetical protein